MKLPPRHPAAALQAVIDQGAPAPVPAPAAPAAAAQPGPAVTGYTLRLYAAKLQQLADARDARRARHRAQALPNAGAISVHSLILEGIELLLRQEARLAAQEAKRAAAPAGPDPRS